MARACLLRRWAAGLTLALCVGLGRSENTTQRVASLIDSAAYVLAHNTRRCLHTSPNVQWSSDVAAVAQAYASQCKFSHSSSSNPADRYTSGGQAGGENLYTSSAAPTAETVLQSWYNSEVDLYKTGSNNYANPGYISGAGHMTQVVWKATTLVGCGYCSTGAQGGFQYLIVCQYWTAGNLNTPAAFQANVLPATVASSQCTSGSGSGGGSPNPSPSPAGGSSSPSPSPAGGSSNPSPSPAVGSPSPLTAPATSPGVTLATPNETVSFTTSTSSAQYIETKYGVPEPFKPTSFLSLSVTALSALNAAITQSELVQAPDVYAHYVAVNSAAPYEASISTAGGLVSAVVFNSFGTGVTKAVVNAFSYVNDTTFSSLGLTPPSNTGAPAFLMTIDRLAGATLKTTGSMSMSVACATGSLSVYSWHGTATSPTSLEADGGSVTSDGSGTCTVTMTQTSTFAAYSSTPSPSPSPASTNNTAWYGLLALLAIPVILVLLTLFVLCKRWQTQNLTHLEAGPELVIYRAPHSTPVLYDGQVL